MKKLFKSVLLSTALSCSASLQALPVGNPAEPSLLIDGILWEGVAGDPCDPCATWCDAISLRAGFYGDYVFNRNFKTDVAKQISIAATPAAAAAPAAGSTAAVSRDNPALDKKMFNSELYTNAGLIVLNIWDRLDLFCTLGTTSSYIKGGSNAFNLMGLFGVTDTAVAGAFLPNVTIDNAIVELYTDTAFSWSVGARGALWECGCATLGAEFQYAQAKPKVTQLNVISNVAQFSIMDPKGYATPVWPLPADAGTAMAAGVEAVKINYTEWQAGAALAYRFNMLSPYIGFKWSKASFDLGNMVVAQDKLPAAIQDLVTWNPSLLGTGAAPAAAAYSDVISEAHVIMNELKSRRYFGFVIGATLIDADKFAITTEGRFIDEKAVHVNGQIRF